MDPAQAARNFIERWHGVTGSELATAQSFVIDLCELLGVPKPHATPEQGYMFERPVTFSNGDGSTSAGRIDCYRRGHFVLEAKKEKAATHTKGFDDALLRARTQGEGYARALPPAEGRPPFVVVVDVGTVIELYAEFSRIGGTYTPFPDPRSHRITLAELARPELLDRLRKVWTEPEALDPARISAAVTRQVSAQLAALAKSLEAAGHSAHDVAAYLSRCLFSMFAEDVELLPKGAFLALLQQHREDPATVRHMLRILWADMDRGGFSAALTGPVLRFNGKLFKGAGDDTYSLLLSRAQIDALIDAAGANWREVEPAIFGTLLERALDATERHHLGAHYTPRAYVERLVLPTVIEPLRAEWAIAQAAALTRAHEAAALEAAPPAVKVKDDFRALARHQSAVREAWLQARQHVRDFLHRLCTLRVLDPACGSANFLYVTLEHLKRLEGEVLNQLAALGDTQDSLDLGRETVTLQQLLGIEINPRAAALAELVLWIGFLQWQIRTSGRASVAEPVVHDYGNIDCRDAVLANDGQEPMRDASGEVVTRWDGESTKRHPATGREVPDDAAVVVQWRYVNPRSAEWPKADFIVGNPPFIGNKRIRVALGDGYADALRQTYPAVPESADFVMYWWHKAADAVRHGLAERFGLITTNSLTMIFNRRVVEMHQVAKPPLSLAFAVPDHPWVDSAGGAAVRIAMTIGVRGPGEGRLLIVTHESEADSGEVAVQLVERHGIIHADLKVGANLTNTSKLRANQGLSHMGVILVGSGFVVEASDPLRQLEPAAIKPYLNGRDLTQKTRGHFIIDLAGMTEAQVRDQFPHCYQRLMDRVRPERVLSQDKYLRENWWLFRRTNMQLRTGLAGLTRYIGTTETAKHRIFSFIDGAVLPDQKIRVVTVDDALVLGVLSSEIHVRWAFAAGGRMGVGNDPVYNNTACFEPFPFPADDTGLTPELADRIRRLAEQLDAHRKARQAAHADVTLTAMYNVLEKLRSGEPLSAKDKQVHEHALVSVLQSLHDELDAAVLQAYGWADLRLPADTDVLLERLVALNARRAAEEAAGTVRWLRPAFQQSAGEQTAFAPEPDDEDVIATTDTATAQAGAAAVSPPVAVRAWPAGLPEQIKAVAEVVAQAGRPLDLTALAAHFQARGRWRDRLPMLLDTLVALGRLRQTDGGRWLDAGR